MFRIVKSIAVLLIATCSFSQKGTQTPYSALGLGELKENEYAAFAAMGGASMASSDSAVINHDNPASYAFTARHHPILQVGLEGRVSTFETSTQENRQQFVSLNQLQLALPIKQRWGVALGLKPFSFTGYRIAKYKTLEDSSKQLKTTAGDGSTYQLFLGCAYRVLEKASSVQRIVQRDTLRANRHNRLSLGLHINYLSGTHEHIRTLQYPSLVEGLNAKAINALRLSDITYTLGLHYRYGWKRSRIDGSAAVPRSLALGVSYSPPLNIRAYRDMEVYSYVHSGLEFNSGETILDTVTLIQDDRGSVQLPQSWKIGIAYQTGPRSAERSASLRWSADLRYQRWSNYRQDFGVAWTNELKDRLSIGMGVEWTPVALPKTRTSFFSKLHYRFGWNYLFTEWRVLNDAGEDTDLTRYGASFGVGVPITVLRSSATTVNFGMNLGRLGTTKNGLIREQYIGWFLGVSITPGVGDLWFLKRKYD